MKCLLNKTVKQICEKNNCAKKAELNVMKQLNKIMKHSNQIFGQV
jgi:hypothetical protein